jgi:hypothetical protein
LQERQRIAHEEERRPDVDGHVLVEALGLPLLERHVADDRSVVHQSVHGPETVDRLAHDAACALDL